MSKQTIDTEPPVLRTSQSAKAITTAYVEAWGHFSNIGRDTNGRVDGRRYRFTSLDAVMAHVREVLSAHGLAVMQPTTVTKGEVKVTTRLMHTSGEWMESDYVLGMDAPLFYQPKNTGSLTTYARRYGLLAMFCLASAEEDDDGTAAQDNMAATVANGGQWEDPYGDGPAPVLTPFDDPDRDPLLATQAQHDAIRAAALALPAELRKAVTEWRTDRGVVVRHDTLTAAQAGELLTFIDSIANGDAPAAVAGEDGDPAAAAPEADDADPVEVVLDMVDGELPPTVAEIDAAEAE